ncbi:MAG: hypothetical protein F6K40_37245, partial [Okeania sp. SIO3I5]|nr:hypothetical protein [Okeania sp. SIO3I5]
NGNLLNDPFDDRAKEWLVEIPVQGRREEGRGKSFTAVDHSRDVPWNVPTGFWF